VAVLQAVGALKHVNLAGFVAAHEDRAESGEPRFSIIAPLYSGGELFDRIIAKGHYSEKEAATVFAKVASGLALLHDKGMIHRCVWGRAALRRTAVRNTGRHAPPPAAHAETSSRRTS